MARPANRTFSFDDDDELSLSSNGRDRLEYHAQPYREQIPPSPEHMSPPPRDFTVSPPSPPMHGSHSISFIQQPNYPTSHPLQSVPRPGTGKRAFPAQTQDESDRTRDLGYSTSTRTASTTTPGMDNLGVSAAGGGIAGIALGIANTNQRESGIDSLRSTPNSTQNLHDPRLDRGYSSIGTDTPYVPDPPYGTHGLQKNHSYSSTVPLGAALASPGELTPRLNPFDDGMQMHTYPQERSLGSQTSFADNPYKRYSSAWDPRVGQGDIDPNDIEDDRDDGIIDSDRRKISELSLGKQSDHVIPKGAVAGGAVGGGFLGGLRSLVGRKDVSSGHKASPSGTYGPITGQGFDKGGAEKSEWLARQTSGRKRLRWIVGTIIALVVIGIVIGATIGGVIAARMNRNSGGAGKSAADDDGSGDLTKDSAEIKKLLGNPDLRKVFPGMAYTPFNAQYPACLSNPPSQNNVTRDMAVLSQLTSAVRLYGTDCNQTEMVIHAIDKLELTGMKVWLGAWLGNNATTNERQLSAMYDIVDQYGPTPFAGVIVGNEVLYRKDLTLQELGNVLSEVKSNFTSKSIDLPVATSDLGDDWTAGLTVNVDIVMSNVHPFFAGVEVAEAAGWTWDFWQTHDVVLTQGTTKRNFISEVGWPSEGGNGCGAAPCTNPTMGSVAGIDEMNTFMDNFVCQSMANKTEYFWFEAFDEPWKLQFNTPGKNWEDKWGLMDSDRNLKTGLKIPDCGGQTVG